MLVFLTNHPLFLVYSCYILLFAFFLVWELLLPLRPNTFSRFQRWPGNILLSIIDTTLVQLLTTVSVANLAYLAHKNKWGLLNQFDLSPLAAFILSFLLLDFLAYGLHILLHKVPLAWLFHRVHHADPDLDVSSGSRLHPFEELTSFIAQQAIIVTLGPSFSAVMVFNALVFILAPFSHANIRMPSWLDRMLRLFILTPDFHRVHHSMNWGESNSNFGFIFTWWDYLFKTYQAQPQIPHPKMKIGLEEFQGKKYFGLWLLTAPFLKKGD